MKILSKTLSLTGHLMLMNNDIRVLVTCAMHLTTLQHAGEQRNCEHKLRPEKISLNICSKDQKPAL